MPALIVQRAGPLATIQDRGRRGRAHEGIPPSGPLDPEAFERAVRAVGSDVAIELPLASARFAVEGTVLASIDGEPPKPFDRVLEVPTCARAVRYLAVRGGFDVPIVLGARATLPTAGFGGLAGRALAIGDRIPIGTGGETPRVGRSVPDPDASPLRVLPVEDSASELFTLVFKVDPRSNRIGTRLSGPSLPAPRGDRLSRPLVPGAIQLPPDGHPIVIGPDGPTMGGYVVIGVLTLESRARLARLRPGSELRFARG
ncbi:MAG: 5-oxoprolinase subunit C family protein [Polyangiales bacterium]